jgi:RNA-directed DNA polymerase
MCIPGFSMDWETYKEAFISAAQGSTPPKMDENRIQECLLYAKSLFDKGIPIIFDGDHLCQLLGFEHDFIWGATNAQERYYRTFQIKKRQKGEYREISEPLPNLKSVQHWILQNILDRCTVEESAKGFVKGKSIKDNARFHRDQHDVLSVDIKNFFPSIKLPKIKGSFASLGYTPSVSTILAKLCSLNESLPQGAPTSPALSNIICRRMDKRIFQYCKKRKLRYTRYADDITISGQFKAGYVIKFIRNVFLSEGFQIHERKIRLMKPHQRQEVTGIVVNKKLQIPREIRMEIRQEMFYISKFGIESHIARKNISQKNYLRHLIGKCNFAYEINPKDTKFKKWKESLILMLPKKDLTNSLSLSAEAKETTNIILPFKLKMPPIDYNQPPLRLDPPPNPEGQSS